MTTDEENELRILLERAVPRLPAPDQRLRQVRDRIRRRRRRRVGGALTVAVVALATAVATGLPLHTGTRQPSGTVQIPAAQSPTVDVSAAAGPPRTDFPVLDGMSLVLPSGWHSLSTFDFTTKEPLVYLSSTPLTVVNKPCGSIGSEFCSAVAELKPGGRALVAVHLLKIPGYSKKVTRAGRLQTSGLDEICRDIGGTDQLLTLLPVGPTSPDIELMITACLSGPTTSSLALVQGAVDSVRFSSATEDAQPKNGAGQ